MHVPPLLLLTQLFSLPCAAVPVVTWRVQVLNYALSMHGVVGDATKLKAGSTGAAFRAEVAEATARAIGARYGSGQQWSADGPDIAAANTAAAL
jgi:hypothetical protein